MVLRPEHRRAAFPAACIAAVTLFVAAYSNSLHNGFHFDDDHVIERNLHLRDLSNIPRFFTDARTFSVFPQNATYRPLVSVTLAIDYAIGGGLNPTPFHVTQLLLFAAVGLLFAWVTRELLRAGGEEPWHRWAALFAATLFCVHTANTQPGNYISARSELLSALGVLGAYLLYLRAPGLRRYQLFLLPMALGALAKTPAVVFAAILLVHKFVFEAEGEWRRLPRVLLESAPAFVVAAGVFLFVEGMNPPNQSYGGGGRLQYLWTQAFVCLRYVGLFFVPAGLSADTDLTLLPSPWDVRVFAGVAVLLLCVGAAWFCMRRESLRPIAVGLAWFWIGVMPTSSIFPLAEVTNDHRMFPGYLGLSLAAATVLFHLAWRVRASWSWATPALAAFCALVLVAHAVGTHLRNRDWLDEETLWADVTRKSPNNGRGWMNYGLTQMRKGRVAEAKALFLHARNFTPNYAVLEVNLGIATAALKEAGAEQHFQRALSLSPDYAGAHYFYARYLIDHGRTPEATLHLRRAMQIDAGDPNPRRLLMAVLAARGESAELSRIAQETLSVGPDPDAQAYVGGRVPIRLDRDDAASWYTAGLGFTQQNRHIDAALCYRMAVQRDAAHADAWNNLGWSLYAAGLREEARSAYERALALHPTHERARNNIALIASP